MTIGFASLQGDTKLHNYQSFKLHFTPKQTIFFSKHILTSWVCLSALQDVKNTIRPLLNTTYYSTNQPYLLNTSLPLQLDDKPMKTSYLLLCPLCYGSKYQDTSLEKPTLHL